MERTKLKLLIIGAAVFVFVFNILFGLFLQNRNQPKEQNVNKEQTIASKDILSYKGEEGRDALTILKQKSKVEQNSSGLVISINGRKTDTAKEFWAFYVNGKFADVGPADYQTKDKDLIEWKVEKIK